MISSFYLYISPAVSKILLGCHVIWKSGRNSKCWVVLQVTNTVIKKSGNFNILSKFWKNGEIEKILGVYSNFQTNFKAKSQIFLSYIGV